MNATFETVRRLKGQLDDWIRDATPATAEARAALTPDQQEGLDHLDDLSDTLDKALFKMMADDLHAPVDAIEKAQAELEVMSGKMTDLAKDISTLATVIQVIGTTVSVVAGIVSAGIGIVG